MAELVRLTVLWCREREEEPPLAETACTRLPVEICGAGCTYRDGEQECHNKVRQQHRGHTDRALISLVVC